MNTVACMKVALAFLGQMHIPVEPLPTVIEFEGPGWFVTQPTIFLKPAADCGVLVHELVHYGQFLEAGPAPDQVVWLEREKAAKRVENLFRNWDQ